jgi:tetratricopeptide (TPR) repeat protein
LIDYDYIARYIYNELSDSEKTAFEQKLKSDAEFAEAYKLYSSIENTMQQDTVGDEDAFREQLTPYQQKYFSGATTPTKSKPKRWLYIAIAAAAILILVFTIIPFNKTTPKTDEVLYAAYAQYEKIDETIRGDNDTVSKTFKKAADLFNTRQFAAAIPLWESIKDKNVQALIWLGVCNMETKNYTAAIANFDTIINGNSVYKDKAQWYKALCYLKQKDKKTCKELLLKITDGSSYFKQANDLLKEL